MDKTLLVHHNNECPLLYSKLLANIYTHEVNKELFFELSKFDEAKVNILGMKNCYLCSQEKIQNFQNS